MAAWRAQQHLLRREIPPGVKTGLQLGAALQTRQRRHATDRRISEQLDEANRRVMTVARVHELLYQSSRIGVVELDEYLRRMCADLLSSTAEPARFGITVAAAPLEISADKVVLLGLIVNELVTNSIRHAYPSAGGSVRVTARRNGDMLAVSVRDAGAGLPAGFEPNRSRGFGMKLVNRLAQQLGGRMEVGRPGTDAEIAGAELAGAEIHVLVPLAAVLPASADAPAPLAVATLHA
jgi:two-component sensor histidine kinase